MSFRILGGAFRGRPLHAPKGKETRPTSGQLREALFNICRNHIEGAHFLDLFAGSGAVGCEALSRGAASALFVDSNRSALESIKRNISALGVTEKASTLMGSFEKILPLLLRRNMRFDCIYADPPYELAPKLLPQLLALCEPLLKKGGSLFFEESSQKRTEILPEIEGLTLLSQREMGAARLLQYRRKEE